MFRIVVQECLNGYSILIYNDHAPKGRNCLLCGSYQKEAATEIAANLAKAFQCSVTWES